jgi:tungstate transport system ATP-binding protein
MGDALQSILPLRLEDVSFIAGGRVIIDRLSLCLEAGRRTVILGANGAGKSVLLRLCHGLLPPSSGRIEWARAEESAKPSRQAMVFQRPVMLRRSAIANVAYGLKMRGLSRDQRQRRASEALERVGLAALAERSARILSIGEQQRLALARAWALDPEVLFLDEPTASLDPGAVSEVERIIQAIHREGKKIVMTTHNLGQAQRIADEIIFLHQGRLVERAPAASFFKLPASDEARSFIKGELPWN